MSEDDALDQSLAVLSSFFVADATMHNTLHRVAVLATEAIRDAKFAGVTMLIDGRPATGVFTDPESPEIDQAQYKAGRGPCLDAFRTGEVRVFHSTLDRDTEWPEFAERCRRHGILSTLSMPLTVSGEPVGALNFYSTAENTFGDYAVQTATVFTRQASIVLANAQAYWDARLLGEHLGKAMEHREVIDQATGIIMGAMRCSSADAFAHLVDQSQHLNTKLRVVAQAIVDDTTRKFPTR
jgi:transcriptional regulator with GAF, ATPase, and Fis domain